MSRSAVSGPWSDGVVWPARLHHDLVRLHQLGDAGGALGGVGLDVHADHETALAKADALAIIPEADDELPAGAPVALWWLDET